MTGPILYGLLFTVLLPALLILWAREAAHNITLPLFGPPWLGYLLAPTGLALMLEAMLRLWRQGGGLPMNAYPPPKQVSEGSYALVPHPIYTGFVLVCLGVSMIWNSPAGLWLVTPTVALAAAALVIGYERLDLQRRFGQVLRVLPPDDDTRPTIFMGVRYLILVVIPWLALFEFCTHLGLAGTAFAFPFEQHLPTWTWTAIIYETSYLTVTFAPTWTRTNRQLRQLMITAWVACLIVYPIYWIVPSAAPRRPLLVDSALAQLLGLERTASPTAAFPSFHVLWAVFVARLWSRPVGIAYVAGIAITCITTGMHYIPDVLAALLLAPFLLEPGRRIWSPLVHLAERIANGWREWRIGPLRVIHHALYAALAGAVQFAIVAAIAGAGKEWKVGITALAGLVGAGAWAQWVEGSSALKRPFGFYGGLIATGLACLLFEERWLLLGAHCLAAPWMQAIGRLRCLENGCCHGAPAASPNLGIRVNEPHSRIVRLAGLANQPIYPTQLYSILANLLLGLTLMRISISGGSIALVTGVYALANGLARFVEEAYRGEPQTLTVAGLRLYQWIAIASILTGAILTTLDSPPSAGPLHLTGLGLALSLSFGALSGAAMGVDFPESNRILSRLT